MPGDLRIGTSGWHYAHWVGGFYPPGTRPADFLAHYMRHFDTVEINNVFYRLPTPAALQAWRRTAERLRPDFLFAVKGSRYVTHMKRLKGAPEIFEKLFGVLPLLGERRGPVVFQLPPRFHVDVERLRAFLAALPPGRYAVEPRDPSWFHPEVYAALAERDAALCLYDLAGQQAPIEVTADFVYIRLHGPAGPYQGSYGDAALDDWAKRCRAWAGEGRDVYCYFDNDEKAFAVRDALRLRERLE